MKRMTVCLMVMLMVALAGCGEVEHHERVGELELTLPWSREIPPNAPVAGGFLSIRNGGGTDDRLVSVRSDAAERVFWKSTHECTMCRRRWLKA